MSDNLIIKSVIENQSESSNTEDGLLKNSLFPFRPVRCNQSDIDGKIQPINGYLYFTLDTQKIYYGTGSEFLPMGGSSGIYYANKTFAEDASDDLSFSVLDFDGGKLPSNVDDLIINVGGNEKRNGFYRVLEIFKDEEYVETAYLPVGGGGGGSASGGVGGNIYIDYVFPAEGNDVIRVGTDYELKFNINAVDNNGDSVPGSGTITWSIGTKKIATSVAQNGENTFNIGPYLSATQNEGINMIKATVSMNTGGEVNNSAVKTWVVKVVNMSVTWDHVYSPNSYFNGDSFTIRFTPTGNVNTVASVWFDNNLAEVYTMEIPSYQMASEKSWTFPSLSYGVHSVSLQLSTTSDGMVFSTDVIEHKLTFISGSDSPTPLITVPFTQTTINQYDTARIPFLVYHPTQENVKVALKINGDTVAENVYNRDLHEIAHTFGTSGTVTLSLDTDGATPWEHEIIVLPIDLKVEEPANWKINLSAKNFFGESDLRAWEENGVNLTFSENFDFINGGIKSEIDENGQIRKYICIKKGTTMTVNYDPFKSTNITSTGLNMKVAFKATNCYKYDAEIMSCVENVATGNGTKKYGLEVLAQNATFRSMSAKDLTTQYCEDSLVELELDIWEQDLRSGVPEENKTNFIMYWVDGVPANVCVYASGANFSHNVRSNIVIGSPDSDVYLYLLKVYERRLTEDEHLNNFIVDAYNATEMMARYNRNNIIDPSSGNISYNLLVKNNPGCHAFVYDMDRMTTSKDDKVPDCTYEHYFTNPETPDEYASGVEVKVQGTSSAFYGVAAYNIDSKFTEGFNIYSTGEHLDAWGMSKTAIPVNYFCTKVNVASCENANNVINAEWYNRFQPYWDSHRRKKRIDGKLTRDCMEFIPGVLFIKDRNDTREGDDNGKKNIFWDNNSYMSTPGANRPALQYAICNMGNSKKNADVFHDIEYNSAGKPIYKPNTCCIEIADNQTPTEWMTVYNEDAFDKKIVGYDGNTPITEGPYYEFRFPDEKPDKFDFSHMKANFMRLVKWFATNNPNAATEKPLEELEAELSAEAGTPITLKREYGPYTFKGHNPEGYDDNTASGVSLKGFTVSDYSGTYTHDTYQYRMAKMLAECEEYLIMDSIVYHYLFIERHTMVDNVAKNTFWSSEDGKVWDLTKNYDNDTADGNNNSGFLTFSYGIEVGDVDDVGKSCFNSIDAVWLTFIRGLYSVRRELYQKLSSKGAWDPTAYLKAFKDFQSVIPERCWIYDYFRKYIRPRRLGLDSETYLARLEGGKKTHQRQQYETYQDIYQNSMYRLHSSVIDLRLNADNIPQDATIDLSYYINCYCFAEIGGKTYHKRAYRGEPQQINIYSLLQGGNTTDGTCYFHYDYIIQSFENAGIFLPRYLSCGNAKRLRAVDISATPEKPNTNMSSLSFSGNTMLETLKARNVGIPTGLGELSLLDLKALTTIDIKGSTIKGVSFAPGGNLTNAKLNDMQTLTADSLSKVETFSVQKNRNNPTYYALESIKVLSCDKDIDTYDLVLNSNALRLYHLENVNWTIKSANDLVIGGDGKLSGIKILDHLLRVGCESLTGLTSTGLTGTITIDVPSVFVDEFAVYKKYVKYFPSLDIVYSSNMSTKVEKAIVLTFYKNTTTPEILFKVLTDGTYTVKALTDGGVNSPTGKAMGTPYEPEDNRHTYIWNPDDDKPDWTVRDSSGTAELLHASVLQMTPTKDTTFVPKFVPEDKTFKITLFNNSAQELTEETKHDITYGSKIALPTYIYVPHSNPNKRYDFKGWISTTDYYNKNPNPKFIADTKNPEVTVTSDMFLYAFCVEANVTDPMPLEYFTFTEKLNNATITIGYDIPGVYPRLLPELPSSNLSCYYVDLKQDVADRIEGCLTIPNNTHGQQKDALRMAYGIGKVSEIRFQENSTCIAIASGALKLGKADYLNTIYMPDSLKLIASNALADNPALQHVHWPAKSQIEVIGANAFRACKKMEITSLPDSVKYVGTSAFSDCSKMTLSTLPKSLKVIDSYAFAYIPGFSVSYFGTDTEKEGLECLGRQILFGSGETAGLTSITLGKSIKYIMPTRSIEDALRNKVLTQANEDYCVFTNYGGEAGSNSINSYTFGRAGHEYVYGSELKTTSDLIDLLVKYDYLSKEDSDKLHDDFLYLNLFFTNIDSGSDTITFENCACDIPAEGE